MNNRIRMILKVINMYEHYNYDWDRGRMVKQRWRRGKRYLCVTEKCREYRF